MKDILTTALGMFMFGDVLLESKNLVGVLIGLAGGIVYAWLQYRSSQQPQQQAYKPVASPRPGSLGSLGRSERSPRYTGGSKA